MQEGGGGGDGMHQLLSILADGEEQARRLLGEVPAAADDQLPLPANKECCRAVAQQLRCTFLKAIAAAKAIEAAAGGGGASGTDSPRSAEESSGAGGVATRVAQDSQGIPKRSRKGLPRWTEKFRIAEASFECTPDDGLSWRKYGQKDILGARFPRGYYRCTYRNTQGCQATKQVQRSDADQAVFDLTYQGEHTCHQKQRPAADAPAVAAARDGGHHPLAATAPIMQEPDVQLLAGLRVETGGLPPSSSFHGHDVSGFSFPCASSAGFLPVELGGQGQLPAGGSCFSPASFASPAVATTLAGSDYFAVTLAGTRGAPGTSELGEVVSAATSSSAAALAVSDYPVYGYHPYQLHQDDDDDLDTLFGHPSSSHGQHGDA
uniref:Uncharacterized protein n=1 Tax=Avena sativa TaxID=4498 RepID=A0ACD6ACN1_AVESA